VNGWYQSPFLILPFHQWIVNKSIQDAHKAIFVCAQDLQCDLTSDAEKTWKFVSVVKQDGTEPTFGSCHTKCVNEVLGESEGDTLRRFQRFPLCHVKGRHVSSR